MGKNIMLRVAMSLALLFALASAVPTAALAAETPIGLTGLFCSDDDFTWNDGTSTLTLNNSYQSITGALSSPITLIVNGAAAWSATGTASTSGPLITISSGSTKPLTFKLLGTLANTGGGRAIENQSSETIAVEYGTIMSTSGSAIFSKGPVYIHSFYGNIVITGGGDNSPAIYAENGSVNVSIGLLGNIAITATGNDSAAIVSLAHTVYVFNESFDDSTIDIAATGTSSTAIYCEDDGEFLEINGLGGTINIRANSAGGKAIDVRDMNVRVENAVIEATSGGPVIHADILNRTYCAVYVEDATIDSGHANGLAIWSAGNVITSGTNTIIGLVARNQNNGDPEDPEDPDDEPVEGCDAGFGFLPLALAGIFVSRMKKK